MLREKVVRATLTLGTIGILLLTATYLIVDRELEGFILNTQHQAQILECKDDLKFTKHDVQYGNMNKAGGTGLGIGALIGAAGSNFYFPSGYKPGDIKFHHSVNFVIRMIIIIVLCVPALLLMGIFLVLKSDIPVVWHFLVGIGLPALMAGYLIFMYAEYAFNKIGRKPSTIEDETQMIVRPEQVAPFDSG